LSAPLLGAAILAGLTGVAHSYLGERYILIRLFRRQDLPHLFGSDVFTRRTLRLAWHVTSIAWWGSAALFWALGTGSARLGLQVLSVMFLVTAIVTGVGSRGRHLAWPVFLLIAIFSWLGATVDMRP
jgi:hypothetical protein